MSASVEEIRRLAKEIDDMEARAWMLLEKRNVKLNQLARVLQEYFGDTVDGYTIREGLFHTIVFYVVRPKEYAEKKKEIWEYLRGLVLEDIMKMKSNWKEMGERIVEKVCDAIMYCCQELGDDIEEFEGKDLKSLAEIFGEWCWFSGIDGDDLRVLEEMPSDVYAEMNLMLRKKIRNMAVDKDVNGRRANGGNPKEVKEHVCK